MSDTNGMNVLITGGTGYVGSHLVAAFVEAGHHVSILTRTPEAAAGWAGNSLVTVNKGSLEKANNLGNFLNNQEVLIHNAIIWDDEPTELELKDVRASMRLFEQAASSGIKHVLYTSSTAVHRPFSGLMNEQSHLHPDSFYGSTKAATEVFISAFAAQTQCKWTIIRPGAVVGKPFFDDKEAKVDSRLRAMVKQAKAGSPIQAVKGDKRFFTPVRELAQLYLRALDQKTSFEQVIGVAGAILWSDIAEQVILETGSASKLELVEGIGLVDHEFDTSKMRDIYNLKMDSREALHETIEHLARCQHPTP